MKLSLTLAQLQDEVRARAAASVDYVVASKNLTYDAQNQLTFKGPPGQPEIVLPINDIAHEQLAEYAGVPLTYYKRMRDEAPHLLGINMNTWLKEREATDQRTVRSQFGNARAVLSDRFARLDNDDLCQAILPALLERDLVIMSCAVTEKRLYIKAVDKTIVKDLPDGVVLGEGHNRIDTISPAVIISNSEVGYGALQIEFGVWTEGCSNLAIFGAKMRRAHTGGRVALSDEAYQMLSNATKALTNAALFAQARDLVKACFDEAAFEATRQRLIAAGQDKIEPMVAADTVMLATKDWGLNEEEQRLVMGHMFAGGNLSRYGLHAAITRASQEDAVSYDRATELEHLGAKVIDLTQQEWTRICRGAKELGKEGTRRGLRAAA